MYSQISTTTSSEAFSFIDQDYSLKKESECITAAKHQGLEIIDGNDHRLVFDLDSEEAYKTFMERVQFLSAKFGMIHLVVTKSKSGNYHAIADLDPIFPPVEAKLCLAIQACLGSDWKKEMLGVLRTLNYNASDSKLFRPQPLQVVYEWNRGY